MPSPLAQLKSFTKTTQGKVVVGGTAVGGVVTLALVRRRGAAGGAPPGDLKSAPPYSVATGTSGMNTDTFPTINTPGIDIGQFEQLLSDLARAVDAAEERNNNSGTGGTNPPPTRTSSPWLDYARRTSGGQLSTVDQYRQAQGWAPPVPGVPYLPGQISLGGLNTLTPPSAPLGSWQPGYVWDAIGQQWRPPKG